jgi:hypothetical protein
MNTFCFYIRNNFILNVLTKQFNFDFGISKKHPSY